jgi:hypothetical protein
VNLTWVGTAASLETRVTRADAPKLLEYSDVRWELEAHGGGTRIAFDALDRLLSGTPLSRLVGVKAMSSADGSG